MNVPAADLQALGDGALTINASVTNGHGNTGNGERDITISATLPGLRINTISGDDVINALEQQQDLVISGSSSHLPAGTTVTVTLGNETYQGVTDSNGNWQVGVPAADLQALSAGTVVVTASATDPQVTRSLSTTTCLLMRVKWRSLSTSFPAMTLSTPQKKARR